jgi:MraZ protein
VFRGRHSAKTDDRGRIKIPSAFKSILDKHEVKEFYITSTDGKSAQIWPLPEWEKLEVQLADKGAGLDVVEKFLDLTSYWGSQVEIDNQARVVLPQELREKAGLTEEVVVIGKLNYLEVKNEKEYSGKLAGESMSPEENNRIAGLIRKTT